LARTAIRIQAIVGRVRREVRAFVAARVDLLRLGHGNIPRYPGCREDVPATNEQTADRENGHAVGNAEDRHAGSAGPATASVLVVKRNVRSVVSQRIIPPVAEVVKVGIQQLSVNIRILLPRRNRLIR
jgi:hypothetical protein